MDQLLYKARTLTEALPWIKELSGKTVVVKYGGSAMTDPALRESVASDIVLMKLVGIDPVIVHGGGADISAHMERLELPVRFEDGLRVTDDEAMEIVKMVLVGKVNKTLVSAINRHGRLAIGVSGDDANCIEACAVSEKLGRVGRVTAIDTSVIERLIEDDFIPVIASVGVGEDGGSYNINADTVAAELAGAMGAAKVIFLTDVDGLYRDFEDQRSLISKLSLDEARRMVEGSAVSRGMLPKVSASVRALEHGVPRAHILNGTEHHALLLEVYTDEGVGTMITHDGGAGEG
jgi:acetylglutamate kinase